MLNRGDATGGRMPEEFEGDLAEAVFWGANLSGACFRDVNLTDAKISHAWLVNVDIDALVDKVVINGVDVTAYVNERDPWYPLRAMLRPIDPEGMRAAWAALEDEWAKTITRAQALPEDMLHESVNDEWSFVQTLRHLVFAMDKWFTAPILGAGFHPIGLPNTGSVDFPWPGLDDNLTPSVSEALAVRADRATRFRSYLATVAATDLTRPVDVLENGTNPPQECIYTVFEEEFWHNRYARRDQALGERLSLVAAGLGGERELAVDALDVQFQVHGTTLAPLLMPCQVILCQRGAIRPGTWHNAGRPTSNRCRPRGETAR